MSSRSTIRSITSRYSPVILSCSRPVRSLQAQLENRLRLRVGELVAASRSARTRPAAPRAAPSPRGRARSISSTTGERHVRAIIAAFASGGVAAALISAMISSTLDSATARPSRMCPRSRALRSSNTVRRVTTSRRCSRKNSSNCLRLSRRGWPSTSATMFMPKLSCSCVSLNRLFRTMSGTSPRFSSMTTRMPRAVGLVAQVGDAFELLLAHQLADAREQRSPCSPGRGSRRR